MRVLVTGSRDWTDKALVHRMLYRAWWQNHEGREPITVVHGACPTGADAIADEWATVTRFPVERHPANWDKHGKAAGFLRNRIMVDLGADLCLAFIKNESKGATMTADLAEKAGIKTVRFTA